MCERLLNNPPSSQAAIPHSRLSGGRRNLCWATMITLHQHGCIGRFSPNQRREGLSDLSRCAFCHSEQWFDQRPAERCLYGHHVMPEHIYRRDPMHRLASWVVLRCPECTTQVLQRNLTVIFCLLGFLHREKVSAYEHFITVHFPTHRRDVACCSDILHPYFKVT